MHFIIKSYNMNRRHFLRNAGMAATMPMLPGTQEKIYAQPGDLNSVYKKLDEILKRPVFRKELFP